MINVKFHRVNKCTRYCDDSGRTSSFIIKNHTINEVKKFAKYCLKTNTYGWLDFDSDVYMIEVINLKSGKKYICV